MPGIADRSRPALAPLDPDAYLTWTWKVNNGIGRPMTVREWWTVFQKPIGMTREEGRRALIQLAAHTRRRQRLDAMRARHAGEEERIAADPALRAAHKAHTHAANLKAEPNSFWPQLVRGGHDLKLPTIEEWTAELNAEYERNPPAPKPFTKTPADVLAALPGYAYKIAENIDVTMPEVEHHLATLLEAGQVTRTERGVAPPLAWWEKTHE